MLRSLSVALEIMPRCPIFHSPVNRSGVSFRLTRNGASWMPSLELMNCPRGSMSRLDVAIINPPARGSATEIETANKSQAYACNQ
jgi:hypothetical protein